MKIERDSAPERACTCARACVSLHLILASVTGKLGHHSRCIDTQAYSGLIRIDGGGEKVKESERFVGPRQPPAAVTPLLLPTLDRGCSPVCPPLGGGGTHLRRQFEDFNTRWR